VKPRLWVSLDGNFWYGGRTSQEERQEYLEALECQLAAKLAHQDAAVVAVPVVTRREGGRSTATIRKFQEPHWRELLLFYEYFHGDTGQGVGASHQTGWTGIVARAMHLFATTTPQQVLELGKVASVVEEARKTNRAS